MVDGELPIGMQSLVAAVRLGEGLITLANFFFMNLTMEHPQHVGELTY